MAWEYLLTVDFGDRNRAAADLFLQIVDAVRSSAAFDHALPARLTVLRAGDILAEFKLDQNGTHRPEVDAVFKSVAARYIADDYGFEIAYALPLFVQLWDEGAPTKEKYYRKFILHGPAYQGTKTSPTGILYEAGDSRHYRSTRTRHLNMKTLMRELRVIAQMGVRSIRGLNLNRDSDPYTHSVVYHDRLASYLQDVYLVTHEHYPVTEAHREHVLDAIVADDPAYACAETASYPLVYSQAGAGGDLRAFYARLIARLRE